MLWLFFISLLRIPPLNKVYTLYVRKNIHLFAKAYTLASKSIYDLVLT